MPPLIAAALVALLSPCRAQEPIPPDWQPAVIDACESAAGFGAEVPAAFARLDLSVTDAARRQGRSLQWSFAAQPDGPTVALTHAAGAVTGPGAISLWVKNPDAHDVRFSVRLVEADGSSYASEAVALGDETAWRELRFPTDALALAPGSEDENGALDFPPDSLRLVVEGTTPAAGYVLYIDEMLCYLAPPEELRVMSISAPEAAAAGAEVEARVMVQAPQPWRRPHSLSLALLGGEVVVAQREVTFGQGPAAGPAGAMVWSETVRLGVPAFAAGGKYRLAVRSPDLRLSGPAAAGKEIEVGGLMLGSLVARVVPHNGVPVVVANDVPLPFQAAMVTGEEAGGSALLVVPATAGHDPYGWARDVRPSSDAWDYSDLDQRVMALLARRPDARMLLRVFLCPPDWWDTQNARECMLFAHGRHAIELPGIPGSQTYPSFASDTWLEDESEALRRFCLHVEGAPYGDHVIGYQLASGEDGRWRYWGATSGLYGDYSAPQTRAFIAWLRDKYEGDIRKLRAAWQRIVRPFVGLDAEERAEAPLEWEDIKVPPLAARTNHPSQSLLDPAAAPEVADYNLFHAHQMAACIGRFAAVAKQASARRKLVGVSYGHILDLCRDPDALATAGHAAFGEILGNDDLDFIMGPRVEFTGLSGVAHGLPSSLVASIQAHGKLWVEERLPGDPRGGAADVFAVVLSGAGGAWPSGAEPPEVPPELLQTSLGWDRSSVSEIALVVDHYSLAYMAQGNALSMPLLARQQAELSEVGAPYDIWLLDDLIAGRIPDYRLYVFVNAFCLDQRAREVVRNHVARNDKTALWVFAPGAMDQTISGRAAFELTGLPVAFVPKTAALRVKIVNASHPLIDGTPKGLEYGTTEEAGPVFFALPGGEVLGTISVPSLSDKGQQEWAGLIARQFDNWTSVYSAAPAVPAVLLRQIARHAGVHLYADLGDVVQANASLLAVRAASAGDKRISLRRAADVRDAVSGERLATAAGEVTANMRAGETRLLYVGDPERFRG